MTKKITFSLTAFLFCSVLAFGQTLVNDFESGTTGLLNAGGGITTSVVANPNMSGLNTSANCLEIKRTGAQWWIFQGVDVVDMAISSSETKFLSMMVNFPAQPDLGVRFDAPDDASNGTEVVRAVNSYTDFNQWQEIVFEIKDSPTATAFTLGTLFRLSIHPDIGYENVPAGQVLNNTNAFGYIDNIQILDGNPLSVSDLNFDNSISLYPNPVQSTFKLKTQNNIIVENVSVYNVLGNKVAENLISFNDNEYDISGLQSGVYVVEIANSQGSTAFKRIVKN
ncbi:T9SS type A sorting domain-containing protein [Algibacter sp. PT7-4]|uniref:T9SS type A sorting domain-containing protein n=1 Tax=Algibacter ulvanivorans TaxID=3400999 RepID=UPI003AAB52AA